jgi:phosphatidylglycerophosphate synthase
VFTTRFQDWVRAGARRAVRLLGLARISPNTITVTGLFINALSGVLIATGQLIAGGVVLLVASVFDVLDGAVARVTGKV